MRVYVIVHRTLLKGVSLYNSRQKRYQDDMRPSDHVDQCILASVLRREDAPAA